jgi:hypothetical protein
MKKLIAVMVLGLIIGTASVFAFGIGFQFGPTYEGGYNTNVAVTFKLDSAPWVFAVDGGIRTNGGRIGISADQWFVNKTFARPFNFFVGWGIYVGLSTGNNFLSVGGRLPIGINAFFLDGMLEPYFQVVPSLGINIGSDTGLALGVAGNLGLRFWF